MKVRLLLVIAFSTVILSTAKTTAATAQSQPALEDVIYLKDGGIIHGLIVEQRPGVSILIQTRDGNRTRYAMDAIERMTREPLLGANTGVGVSRSKKEPLLAFGLSFLLPGAGQAYNGQWAKGGLMFGGAAVGFVLFAHGITSCIFAFDGPNTCDDDASTDIGAVLYFGSVLWSLIDAPISASHINKRSGFAIAPALVPLRSMAQKPALGLRLGMVVF